MKYISIHYGKLTINSQSEACNWPAYWEYQSLSLATPVFSKASSHL